MVGLPGISRAPQKQEWDDKSSLRACVDNNCLATQVSRGAFMCLTNESSQRSLVHVSSLWDAAAFQCLDGQVGSFPFPDHSTCQHTGRRIPAGSCSVGAIWARLPWQPTEEPLLAESSIPGICGFSNAGHLSSLFSVLLNEPGHHLAFYLQSGSSARKFGLVFSRSLSILCLLFYLSFRNNSLGLFYLHKLAYIAS